MEITPKMLKAIALLYEGKSKQATAFELGLSIKTINRWTDDADFKRAMVDMAAQQIGQLVPEAVTTLSRVMREGRHAEQLQAARTILEYAAIGERQDSALKVSIEYV